MGIKGLLKHLCDVQKKINISEIEGSTVGIDGHSWMHKAIYKNGYEILINKNFNSIISYIENKLNIFIKHKVKVILVFDGDNHILKKNVNSNRNFLRSKRKKEGFESLMKKNKKLANKYFSESIDITPEFIFYICEFIKNNYKNNEVEFIISPYEADSQLAYLNRKRIVDFIITEDSDLFLFGANDILFKMDFEDNFIYIKRTNVLNKKEFENQEKLLNICILSGCDYLPNPKGIGIKKSIKLFKEYNNIKDIFENVIKVKGFEIINNYLEEFNLAFLAFYYSKVYCPIKKVLVNLNEINLDKISNNHKKMLKQSLNYYKSFDFLGKDLKKDILIKLVNCEINPITKINFKEKRIEKNSIILNKINLNQKILEYNLKNEENLKLNNELIFKKLIIKDNKDYISDEVKKIIEYKINN